MLSVVDTDCDDKHAFSRDEIRLTHEPIVLFSDIKPTSGSEKQLGSNGHEWVQLLMYGLLTFEFEHCD